MAIKRHKLIHTDNIAYTRLPIEMLMEDSCAQVVWNGNEQNWIEKETHTQSKAKQSERLV